MAKATEIKVLRGKQVVPLVKALKVSPTGDWEGLKADAIYTVVAISVVTYSDRSSATMFHLAEADSLRGFHASWFTAVEWEAL